MSVDEQESISGLHLTVSLHRVPLGNVLNSLWALLSYQGAEYAWVRKEQTGVISYQLFPHPNNRELAVRLRSLSQEIFEEEVAVYLKAAFMTPEQRKDSMNTILAASGREDQKANLTDYLAKEQRMWLGLRVFAETFSPEVRTRILRGQIAPKIAFENLPSEGQQLVAQLLQQPMTVLRTRRRADGTVETSPAPPPRWLQFMVEPAENKEEVSNSLYIMLEGRGGYAYAGGTPLQKLILQKIYDLWLLKGDTLNSSLSTHLLVEPKVPEQSDTADAQNREPSLAILSQAASLEKELLEVSESVPLSVLASLPRNQNLSTSRPFWGHSLHEYLDDLFQHSALHVLHKWRDGLLLCTYASWPLHSDDEIPYQAIRKVNSNKSGLLSLNDLTELAGKLTQGQFTNLCMEFPSLQGMRLGWSLLAFAAQYPALVSEQGIALTPQILHILDSLPGKPLNVDAIQQSTSAIRLVQKDEEHDQIYARTIRIQFLNSGKQWVSTIGFTQQHDAKADAHVPQNSRQ